MPIRDHIALLPELDYFDLTRSEHRALQAFNQAFDDMLIAHINTLFKRKNPLLTPNASTVALAKKNSRILKANWANATIILPDSIKMLDGQSLLKLALHADGEYVYKYLNDVICQEIVLHVKACTPSEVDIDSIEAVANLSNTLSTAAIDHYLKDSPVSKNEIFIKMKAIFSENFSIKDKNAILYTDGRPLEYIGSNFISICLRSARKESLASGESISAERQKIRESLRWAAASNGSFFEAHNLTLDYEKFLLNSKSLEEATHLYRSYCTDFFEPHLLPRYPAVSHLMLLILQIALLALADSPIAAKLTKEERLEHKKYIECDIYHHLKAAKYQESQCQNTLRLSLFSDNFEAYLATIVGVGRLENPKLFKTIEELQNFFRDGCPELWDSFANDPFAKQKRKHPTHFPPRSP